MSSREMTRNDESACDTYPGFESLMLPCLVIYVNGNEAGPGFYHLAATKNLFHRGDDKTAFWVGQLNGVYDYFATHWRDEDRVPLVPLPKR